MIYDETRNGVEFKIRLTGDAVDGDYVQLLDVRVVSSPLTCVNSLFCLFALFILTDGRFLPAFY